MLRRIHSNSDNLVHGRLPCLRPLNSLILAQSDAVGGRPHQQPPQGLWIPGLRSDRLSPAGTHPGMTIVGSNPIGSFSWNRSSSCPMRANVLRPDRLKSFSRRLSDLLMGGLSL